MRPTIARYNILLMKCSSGHEVEIGASFCGKCGVTISSRTKCSNGHPIAEENLFCPTCGVKSVDGPKLSAPVQVETESEAPAPAPEPAPASDLEIRVAEALSKRLASLDEAKRNKWLGDAYRELPGEMKQSGQSHPRLIASHYAISAATLAALPLVRLGQLSSLKFKALNVQPRDLGWNVDCLTCGKNHGVLWFENEIYSSIDGHKISEIQCSICERPSKVGSLEKNTIIHCSSRGRTIFKFGWGSKYQDVHFGWGSKYQDLHK
jgi:hypothetical protein